VDDRLHNCDAARAAGMRAFHFRGDVAELEAELGRSGLL
jgi:FMN phosphatase YigB (HAD superfamily)